MFTIQVSPLSIVLVKLHVVWLIFEVLFATILEFFNIWGVRLSVVVCFSANSQFFFASVPLRSLNSYIVHSSSIPCRNNEDDNSWTVPFRKRSTSLYVRWTYKAWFFPKVTSLNAAFSTSFMKSDHMIRCRVLVPSFPHILRMERLGQWPPFQRSSCPFCKRSTPFSLHLENFSTINKIINKGKYVSM